MCVVKHYIWQYKYETVCFSTVMKLKKYSCLFNSEASEPLASDCKYIHVY